MIAAADMDLMLATAGPPFSRDGWIFEPKYDGYRMLCSKDNDGVHLLSRNRKDATSWFPELDPVAARVAGQFHSRR